MSPREVIPGRFYMLQVDEPERFIEARARQLASMERAHMAEIGITPPEKEMGVTDIDSDLEDDVS